MIPVVPSRLVFHDFMISSRCGALESPRVPSMGTPRVHLGTGQAEGGDPRCPQERRGHAGCAWHCPHGSLYPHLCTSVNKLLCIPTAAVPTWNLLLPPPLSLSLGPAGCSCPGVPVSALNPPLGWLPVSPDLLQSSRGTRFCHHLQLVAPIEGTPKPDFNPLPVDFVPCRAVECPSRP